MLEHSFAHVAEKEKGTKLEGWTYAGETVDDAYFDAALTTCRRVDHGDVALQESRAIVRPELVLHLNRLAYLLWLWSREHV